MAPSLSPRPDLKQIKRQAKELLRAQRAGDPAVCDTLRGLPRLAGKADRDILSADIRLQEAQHALAKRYGFDSWADLKRHVESAPAASVPDLAAERASLMDRVAVRPMTPSDVPALRRFDDELAATVADVNAQYPAGGHSTSPGGPWADDDELAAHVAKYERHGGVILLAEDAGRVVGFADLWPADEPEPFGRSLNVECIDYLREYYLAGLETRLLAEAEGVARRLGLRALDIGTNTCSGEYASLRRFGLRVFYEYDRVTCRCRAASGDAPEEKRVTAPGAALSGLIRVNHWSPTDFTFRADDEPSTLVELRWPDRRAVVELWHHVPGGPNAPVPPSAPNRAEVFAPPEALESAEMMAGILAASAGAAGRLGAERIELACPSDLHLPLDALDVTDRRFAFAWLRKRLD